MSNDPSLSGLDTSFLGAGRLRCAVPDDRGVGLAVCQWSIQRLGWAIDNSMNGCGGYTLQQWSKLVAKALALWEEVCGIEFTGNAKNVVFKAGNTTPLGTPGNTLGYAEMPCGSVYGPGSVLAVTTDKADLWSRYGPEYTIAYLAHEIGHVLGLPHTQTGLMSPYVNPNVTKPQKIDISAALVRYPRSETPPTPEPEDPVNPTTLKFATIFATGDDGTVYKLETTQ